MEIPTTFSCAFCGEINVTFVDVSAGAQSYIEDCQVCCRPNQLRITVDEEGNPHIISEFSG